MSDVYTLIKGTVPLLISMPHNGQLIPADIAKNMTNKAKAVHDTDWYKDKLYDFAKSLGAYILIPNYSRYVIDLNRDPNGVDLYPGANSTELCPTTAFDLSPLYIEGKTPSQSEITKRIGQYWQPYHDAIQTTLAEIKQQHSRAVLLEAHSILSKVPRFFEGQLPDFNFGTASGKSCSEQLLTHITELDFSPYTMVTNGRFKGGYITRAYGDPANDIHAVQLELSQRTYLDENNFEYLDDMANQVKPKLKNLVQLLISYAQTKE
ncbi:N-formylglutamate deformylase [Thalassotalea profundi]|uniref:N-formylglutamate deformylase n=1 Tax=Thalassotalea profundi TaxID=2036687 RepID=A0ABQ3IR32_9GAMM|nr:N-formylglutamate deformylase [Thalassotalea profundi]GHE88452.1 N-formylglutamate deformylase [Thalassotalea profundi]